MKKKIEQNFLVPSEEIAEGHWRISEVIPKEVWEELNWNLEFLEEFLWAYLKEAPEKIS